MNLYENGAATLPRPAPGHGGLRSMPRDTLTAGTKRCRHCGEQKPLPAFYRSSKSADGRQAWCKDCHRTRQRDPARVVAATKKYRVANRDKQRAHSAVKRALLKGHMVRPEACDSCGSLGDIHAHHADYSRPLDVRWLCRQCHVDVHRAEAEHAA